jgi:hypothetical protein
MRRRSGKFWDGVEGRAPKPRAAATMGWEFIDADVEEGTIEVSFAATDDFTNPMGALLSCKRCRLRGRVHLLQYGLRTGRRSGGSGWATPACRGRRRLLLANLARRPRAERPVFSKVTEQHLAAVPLPRCQPSKVAST